MSEAMMRVKTSAIVLALLSLSVCLIPAPIKAASLVLNPNQGTVGSEVTINALCNYGTGEYYIYWGETMQLLLKGVEEGCNDVTFIVPKAARGQHKVTLKMGDDTFDIEFKVMPSISLGTGDGTVGSELAVTGKGFNTNETGIEITYDGDTVATDITADNKGNWQSTFEIPPSHSGSHFVDAKGTTPAEEVDDQTFSVIPKISINPTSGGVGAMIAVDGFGFSNGETGITVIYDGLAVKTAISSDSRGSWRSNFFIPASTKGRHSVSAFGAITAEIDVDEVSFSVSPAIKLEMVSGHLGDNIHVGDGLWVSGIGFEENEAGIQLTFDGTMVASGIIADAKGSWAVQLAVPMNISGEHIINSSGDTTKASDVADAVLIISPQIDVNPTSGAIGDEVAIKGTGFGGSQPLTISYDGNQVAAGSATDSKGSFSASFNVPKSLAGDHPITVADATASVSLASFSVESTPPPTPRQISPEAGSRSGLISNTITTFDWAAVDDPSGIIYLLELGQSADFSSTVLRKEGLTQPQYTLTEDEALAKGEYYWRVKAIDGAGNESEWTNGQLFKIGLMEWWLLLIIILTGISIIAIIWRVISISRRGGWK